MNYIKSMNTLFERKIIDVFKRFSVGSMQLILPNGRTYLFGDSNARSFSVQVKDARFFRALALSGDIGLAEAYLDQWWDSANPAQFIEWLLLNQKHFPKPGLVARILDLKESIHHAFNRNSRSGSRRNIMAHYDLGNDFYRLFLDQTMSYSSAYFVDSSQTLESAQNEKYDRICRKLDLKPNMHVLEIGCGWGGFAHYAATKYGCRITGTTISPSQKQFAQERMFAAGLSEQVTIIQEDYRDLTGKYDAIVSIEMLEAVGHAYLQSFFKKCDELLIENGLLALQFITCSDARYPSYRKSADFIRKYIFPGGHLPSVAAIHSVNEVSTELNLAHFESFGAHYGKTLLLWRERFEDNWEHIEALGFDAYFRRLWRFYFCYCEAAFQTRHINVVQGIWARSNDAGMHTEKVSEASSRPMYSNQNAFANSL
jgi:cyclopropane-fatty-acyl-phospholipid synthase